MEPERRNPYLILAVDPAASPEERRAAHCRRRQHAVDNPGDGISAEDIDWALEQLNGDRLGSWYLLPGNPSVYDPAVGVGLFAPPAEPLERKTDAPTDAEVDDLTARALRQALDAVVRSLGTSLFRGPYDDGVTPPLPE
jgi:hypothetical protein